MFGIKVINSDEDAVSTMAEVVVTVAEGNEPKYVAPRGVPSGSPGSFA